MQYKPNLTQFVKLPTNNPERSRRACPESAEGNQREAIHFLPARPYLPQRVKIGASPSMCGAILSAVPLPRPFGLWLSGRDLVSLNQSRKIEKGAVDRNDQGLTRPGESKGRRARITKRPQPEQSTGPCRRSEPASDYKAGQDAGKNGGGAGRWRRKCMLELM